MFFLNLEKKLNCICCKFQIKTRPITREVIATYALNEVTIEMVIALPENYPLGTITVVSEKRVGVSAATWDKWLLQLNVFLQYQVSNCYLNIVKPALMITSIKLQSSLL